MSGCTLDNCTPADEGGGCFDMADLSSWCGVKNSNVSVCSASWGGGVCIYYSNVTGGDCEGRVEYGIVSGCRFSDCSATSCEGGGIEAVDVSASTVRSCSFCTCSANTYGGGIHWGTIPEHPLSLSEWIGDCIVEASS